MYDRAMRLILLVPLVVACGGKPEPLPPKPPNTELIVGEYEQHAPDGTKAMRFRASGDYEVAKTKGELGGTPIITGTFKLDGDQLTFNQTKGPCADKHAPEGTYKVVISKIGIHFAKVSDDCGDGRKLDGQTWWRVK